MGKGPELLAVRDTVQRNKNECCIPIIRIGIIVVTAIQRCKIAVALWEEICFDGRHDLAQITAVHLVEDTQ
jgi:hypothetical protein